MAMNSSIRFFRDGSTSAPNLARIESNPRVQMPFLTCHDVAETMTVVDEFYSSEDPSIIVKLSLNQFGLYPLDFRIRRRLYSKVTILEAKCLILDVSQLFELASSLPNLDLLYIGQTSLWHEAGTTNSIQEIRVNPSVTTLILKIDVPKFEAAPSHVQELMKFKIQSVLGYAGLGFPNLKKITLALPQRIDLRPFVRRFPHLKQSVEMQMAASATFANDIPAPTTVRTTLAPPAPVLVEPICHIPAVVVQAKPAERTRKRSSTDSGNGSPDLGEVPLIDLTEDKTDDDDDDDAATVILNPSLNRVPKKEPDDDDINNRKRPNVVPLTNFSKRYRF